MSKDEIIAMAREAGIDVGTAWGVADAAIERFAALVAAKERERLAKMVKDFDEDYWFSMTQDECVEIISDWNIQ